MKSFEYLKPRTVEEACSMLDRYKDQAKIIAGGQSLLTLMKERLLCPLYLVDIADITALNYLNYDPKEGLRMGGLTTHRTIETSLLIKEKYSVLSEMEKKVASVHIRNLGTIGGNLCHADPAGDLAPPLIALGATVKIVGLGGERFIPLENFFTNYFEISLQPDEILTEIHVPPLQPDTGVVYLKYSLREVDPALVGVAATISLDLDNRLCKDVKIVLGAVASTPIRARKAEEVIKGKTMEEDLMEEVAHKASSEASPVSDAHASEEYKREMVMVFTKEALGKAYDMAKSA